MVTKLGNSSTKEKRLPWLRISGDILLLPPYDFIACRWTTGNGV
jgi:hypothetical protein